MTISVTCFYNDDTVYHFVMMIQIIKHVLLLYANDTHRADVILSVNKSASIETNPNESFIVVLRTICFTFMESHRPQSTRKVTAITCITWCDEADDRISCIYRAFSNSICTVKIAAYITFVTGYLDTFGNCISGYKIISNSVIVSGWNLLSIDLLLFSSLSSFIKLFTSVWLSWKFSNSIQIQTHSHKPPLPYDKLWHGKSNCKYVFIVGCNHCR